MFNYLLCRDRAVPLPAVCAGLCYWLIESVFCAAALPWRLVLAHTHCSRTNENTPRHLPKRDTPSPSPCPSNLAPPLFLLFWSHFYSFHHAPTSPPPFPTFSILPSHFNSFDPPLSLCLTSSFPPLLFPPSSFLLPASLHPVSVGGACVCVLMWGGSGCRVKVLPYSDRRLSECSVGAIHRG